jgi:hypothetical protein
VPLGVTKDSVLNRFPELQAEPLVTNLVWTQLIADANMEIPITSWADQASADRAGTWLIAHMVAFEKQRITDGLAGVTAPGQLQSITVGPVTKTWAQKPASTTAAGSAMDDDVLNRSAYGREYLRLRSMFCRSGRKH